MKISILIALLLLTLGAVQKPDFKLEIGSVLPAKYVSKRNHLYMTHPAQLRPFIERKINGVKYIIAYEKESREIKYIYTYDDSFKTSDGLQVGSYIEVNSAQIVAYPGWAVHGPETKDGWTLLIGFVNKMTTLNGDQEVVIDALEYPPLQFGQTVKVKIRGFVKGGN